ncbi:DUF2946 family protein [Acinetobacter silvestris]|uniref:DUF2946 domain-containing protein n=1 Tax=Acinetobacter silvestris TaxID=1977882 RepID=A0A1Y3CA27_9GAMM|nr:DUF2946 family protein [Acinetobacter silvestris]OTG63898.1 DUF2946 domain-containing protein [Acinetobacter silvestris]
MLLRSGLLLGFAAVFLQIAVLLQPLLPKQYQIAPVCETISQVLIQSKFYEKSQHASHHVHRSHEQHSAQKRALTEISSGHDHHDPNHQCQYCTVYGNLVLPPDLDIKPVLDRIQVRLIAFQKAFRHVYFVLQRLFLIPQGRAPPLFA